MSPAEPGLPGADDALRTAFRRLLLSLADSKRLLGIRYSDWLLGAPSIEAGIAASSMAQDEWGHARLLYASLKDFGDDPKALEHDRDAARYASVDPLDTPFEDWARVIAGVVLIDGALAEALTAVHDGEYEPIRGRLSKMMGEEEFHRSLGEAWFRKLAGSEEGARRLRDAVGAILPPTLRALAPDDEAHGALAEAGLFLPADDLKARYRDRVGPMLELLDMDVTESRPLADGWDADRGRGTGHPEVEAIERARGDLNRALFVE